MKTDSPRIGIVDSGCAADGMDECRSASFVLVDGQRVRHATLTTGSRVEIGSTRMTITSPGADV